MATRSLGSLTLDLILKTGGFQQGMDKAAKQSEQTLRRIQNTGRKLGAALTAGFAAIGASNLIGAVVRNTIEAENAMAQLEARLKSTGGASGVTARELVKFAGELQGVSTYGDDAILAMQGVLLSFTNIRGREVFGATQAILDLATALGTDLNSAAVLVGKALNDPVAGLSALSRVGIQFTDAQKKTIKAMVEGGDAAKAQGLILDQLKVKFGGAAEAAGKTFGGSIERLKNAFGDLLEADGSGLPDVTGQLDELVALLRDPDTVAGMQNLTSGIINLTGALAGAVAEAANFTKWLGEELAATFNGPALDDLVRMTQEIDKLQGMLDAGNGGNRIKFFGEGGLVEYWSDEELKAEIARLKQAIRNNFDAGSQIAPPIRAGGASGGGGGGGGGPVRPALEEVRITLPKIEMTAMEQFYADLYEKTRTQNEAANAAAYEQKEALRELWEAGRIGVDTYNARVNEINDQLLPEFEVTVKKLSEVVKEETDEVNEFQKQAARNTQDIIADTLVSGFKGGKTEILDEFYDMITRMAAQAIAADIAGKLFGSEKSSSDGWVGAAFGMLSSYFGGARAGGGPVASNRSYLVGERGPELFVPASAGRIVAAGTTARLGGGLTQNIYVQGRPDQRSARQMALESLRAQRAANARLG